MPEEQKRISAFYGSRDKSLDEIFLHELKMSAKAKNGRKSR